MLGFQDIECVISQLSNHDTSKMGKKKEKTCVYFLCPFSIITLQEFRELKSGSIY